ncbi:unnamed protein product [Cyclocybe aegerita]|uniref:Methyltransferase small domain-containing protein n=1 Tax=Cyclocybe aegerita TaxID=1973307 RepID=A0A8S0W674_CYCAE|nr:unnamed protein product [Cyclocybe aegerita]
MIPTPDLSHLTSQDYDQVYEPAEDTFLLLDALEEDAKNLRDINACVCLEVGIRLCLELYWKNSWPFLYLCTDINPHACKCTVLTGKQNHIDLNVVNGSLVAPFGTRLANNVDVLLFNPPYVPTSEEEVSDAQLSRELGGSWAGGSDGMRITNVLLGRVEGLLSPEGRFYLVALKQNNVPQIVDTMRQKYGFLGEVVLQRRAGREHLFIIRFVRESKNSSS